MCIRDRIVIHRGGMFREKTIRIEQARKRESGEAGTRLPEKLPAMSAALHRCLCGKSHLLKFTVVKFTVVCSEFAVYARILTHI